jgi:hypothetical protein
MSFVKYNRPAARFVWDNGYYLSSTLKQLDESFDANATPIAERSIKPMPPTAVTLKLVFC